MFDEISLKIQLTTQIACFYKAKVLFEESLKESSFYFEGQQTSQTRATSSPQHGCPQSSSRPPRDPLRPEGGCPDERVDEAGSRVPTKFLPRKQTQPGFAPQASGSVSYSRGKPFTAL
jgi:hypothetical protein